MKKVIQLAVISSLVSLNVACSKSPTAGTATRPGTVPVAISKKSVFQSGKASWYGGRLHGGPTASGERYNQNAMTAAHKKLPMGSRVRVTNVANGKSCVVRINDRGPFIRGRVIDLSRAAFLKIASLNSGVISVKLERL
jgi:rare lipoprotein A